MIKEYTIENFKAFAGPATVPIKPITLIFGPNSSGKSSIFQSMLMLKQTIKNSISQEDALMPKGDLVDVGNYREFINNHDISKEFSFTIMLVHPEHFLLDINLDVLHFPDEFANYAYILERSVKQKSIGMRISFNYDVSIGIFVSEVALVIENRHKPFIVYRNIVNRQNISFNRKEAKSILKYDCFLKDHDYCQEFFQMFQDVIMIDDFVREYSILPEQAMTFENKIKLATKYIRRKPRKAKIINGDFFYNREYLLDLSKRVIEKIKKNKNYEFFFKIFECMSTEDYLQLDNFLPVLLNNIKMNEIVRYEVELCKNPALIILSIANLFKVFFSNIRYIGPLRGYPEKYFSYSAINTDYVGHTGKYVYDIIINNQTIVKAINKQMDRLNLGYDLVVTPLVSETGDIADLFALRLLDKATNIHISITDVGFGISQVLPIVVQGVISKEKTILIEQPELHLHPAQQAELGDMFIESALGENKNTFLIETHSEHLILRIMRRIRETHNGNLPSDLPPIKPDDVAILYVEQDGENGSIVREMPLNERGELVKAWPGGFFEEGLREVLS
jgi:AAA15 family ATPase/GTPase